MTRFFRTLPTLLVAAFIGASSGLSAAPVLEDGAAPAPRARVSGNYLVRMSESPVVAYRGGVAGLKATAPKRGDKIDPNNPAVANYAAWLDSKHNAALAAVGGGKKVYDYRYAVNGFAAKMSDEQAARLAKLPGVVSVERDVSDTIDTLTTPKFLGLTAADHKAGSGKPET